MDLEGFESESKALSAAVCLGFILTLFLFLKGPRKGWDTKDLLSVVNELSPLYKGPKEDLRFLETFISSDEFQHLMKVNQVPLLYNISYLCMCRYTIKFKMFHQEGNQTNHLHYSTWYVYTPLFIIVTACVHIVDTV